MESEEKKEEKRESDLDSLEIDSKVVGVLKLTNFLLTRKFGKQQTITQEELIEAKNEVVNQIENI